MQSELPIIEGLTFDQTMKLLSEHLSGRFVFTTSFGQEDQVVTHLLQSTGIKVEVATLDTGRLFPETYEVYQATEARYDINIKAYYPSQEQLEKLVADQGINGFYKSIDARKNCCHVRKVEPLRRALSNASLWITGLRAEQSENRKKLPLVTWDDQYQLYKYNPLLHWSWDEVQAYLMKHKIPQNSLHAKGYWSIGCAPCTRATEPGEDIRAGRWWWENSHKECGLHENVSFQTAT
jgi:phosphoadenosine phosphosulfate reductase